MVTVDKSEGPRNGQGMEQHTCKVMGETNVGRARLGWGRGRERGRWECYRVLE